MRREISEVKPVETKSRENYLDSSVRKAFERLQEGKTARAENKLDSSVRKSFEKLESHSTYEKRLQQKMENPEKDLQKLVGEYKEILNAEQDLHVDFKSNRIIPVADCGDNDFAVYYLDKCKWSRFNIIDETAFKERTTLEDVL